MIDGVECASMEGFLQSLKFSDPEMQKRVCTLVGKLNSKVKRKDGGVNRNYIGKEMLLTDMATNIKNC